MNNIDIRFKSNEISLLKRLIGKRLTSIEHDPFVFTNTVSQVVKFNFDGATAYLYSFTEPLDYFGTTEDVAVLSFEETIYPAIDGKTFVTTPIADMLKRIVLVHEHQELFENGKQTYDVWLTRGIILDFGDYQFSFEKAVWFSEEIKIQKGYDLIATFCTTDDFCKSENWKQGVIAKCVREMDTLQS